MCVCVGPRREEKKRGGACIDEDGEYVEKDEKIVRTESNVGPVYRFKGHLNPAVGSN